MLHPPIHKRMQQVIEEFSGSVEISLKKPLILVLEDDEDNLLLISHILSSLECRYLMANNGKDFLELVRSSLPDLILLDIVLSEKMDGIELIRILKEDNFTSSIPIIAVTGLTSEKDKKQIKQSGCNDYLCKPFLIEELEAKIDRFLK